MARTLHFKSKKAYDKWIAYGNIHHAFQKAPGESTVFLAGHLHRAKHKRKKRR